VGRAFAGSLHWRSPDIGVFFFCILSFFRGFFFSLAWVRVPSIVPCDARPLPPACSSPGIAKCFRGLPPPDAISSSPQRFRPPKKNQVFSWRRNINTVFFHPSRVGLSACWAPPFIQNNPSLIPLGFFPFTSLASGGFVPFPLFSHPH